MLCVIIYKQNLSNEVERTRPDFSRSILINRFIYAHVKSKQFDIDRFQSADWNRVKIDAAHVTIWSVDKNRTTKIVSCAPGL